MRERCRSRGGRCRRWRLGRRGGHGSHRSPSECGTLERRTARKIRHGVVSLGVVVGGHEPNQSLIGRVGAVIAIAAGRHAVEAVAHMGQQCRHALGQAP